MLPESAEPSGPIGMNCMTQTRRPTTTSAQASEFRVSPQRVVPLTSAQSHLEQTLLQFQLNLAGLQEQLDLELGAESPKRLVLQEALDEDRSKLHVCRKGLQRLLKGVPQSDGSVKVRLNTLLAKLPASEIQKASATDYVLGSIQEESSEDQVAALCSRIHRLGQSFAHLHQQVGQVVEVQQVRQLNAQLQKQADALAVREQELQAKVRKQEDFRKKLEAKRAELKEIRARLEVEAERGRTNQREEREQLQQLKATLQQQQQAMLQQSFDAFQTAQQEILARQQQLLKKLEQDQQRLEQEKAWVKSLLRNLLDQHDRIHSVQSDLRGAEQSHLLERESALHEERGWLKLEQSKLRRSLSDPDEPDLSHLLH
ncbi:MAG: hypothetical protein CL923_04435 [Deltaproteobacteria bacterium]|nr:hypothetical protein [Deltaproteobacteria bacterium]